MIRQPAPRFQPQFCPCPARPGEPIALRTVTKQLKTAHRFIRWLHRSEDFKWTQPMDAEEALRVHGQRLRTDDEVAQVGHSVKVWVVGELATLYRHAKACCWCPR
jgi:hypothetical protein